MQPIDLSMLPAPDVVESIDYETILDEMIADLRVRDSSFSALVESDPAYKILEVAAYREMLLRQRVNDSARAVMLAYAGGSDLDQIGANYAVKRHVIGLGDPDGVPPVPPTMEPDEDYRRRIQLSMEGYTTAGSRGSYVYHALSAHGSIADVSVTSPEPGRVVVTVLDRFGEGVPDEDVLSAVDAVLSAEDVRPLTDKVEVNAAEIVSFDVEAQLVIGAGPDPVIVRDQARKRLVGYLEEIRKIGVIVPLSGIYAALHVGGVQKVRLLSPQKDVQVTETQASYCREITIS